MRFQGVLQLKHEKPLSRDNKEPKRAMVCITDHSDFVEKLDEHTNALYVEYAVTEEGAKERGLTVGLEGSGFSDVYVMSPIDAQDKYSKDYHACLALVVMGTDKETEKEVSFLSHQSPEVLELIADGSEIGVSFENNLDNVFAHFCERCVNVEALILGGTQLMEFLQKMSEELRDYISARAAKKGIKIEVAVGPKADGYDDLLVETNTRRLILARKSQDELEAEYPEIFQDIEN